jgi:uncharacterized protein (TIGR02147 family)
MNAIEPKVYSYSEPHLYLRDILAFKQKRNALFSMRAWAKQMGFTSHTSLLYFVNGERPIRPQHVDNLNKGLRLEGDAERYFRLLVHSKNARSAKDKEAYNDQLRLLVPSVEQFLLDTEKFKSIADWLHMAILEMTRLKDFKSDYQWIASRLKFPVLVDDVAKAVVRLINLGLLEEKDGTWIKTQARLTTPKDRASESIREHHRQVINNALVAIDHQGVSERVLNSCTLTVDINKFEEAKELINKFRSDMAKLLEKDQGDETYQLSVQFFKLTETTHHSEGTEL